MDAVLRGEAARRDAELLERVGKRQREIDVLLRVVVRGAVERVADAGRQAAGHGNPDAPRRGAVRGFGRLHRRAREHEQVGDLASLQRELDDPLLLDHRADARAAHVHDRRRGFHRHGFFERAERERRVHRRRRAHLQHEPRLHVGAETLQRNLEAIRAGRQVRDQIGAGIVGDDRARQAGGRLHHRHGGARQHGAARVGHASVDLGGGELCPRGRGGQESREKSGRTNRTQRPEQTRHEPAFLMSGGRNDRRWNFGGAYSIRRFMRSNAQGFSA